MISTSDQRPLFWCKMVGLTRGVPLYSNKLFCIYACYVTTSLHRSYQVHHFSQEAKNRLLTYMINVWCQPKIIHKLLKKWVAIQVELYVSKLGISHYQMAHRLDINVVHLLLCQWSLNTWYNNSLVISS